MTTIVKATNAASGKVTITLPEVSDTVECTINYRANMCAYEVKLWEDGISQYAEVCLCISFCQTLKQWQSIC